MKLIIYIILGDPPNRALSDLIYTGFQFTICRTRDESCFALMLQSLYNQTSLDYVRNLPDRNRGVPIFIAIAKFLHLVIL